MQVYRKRRRRMGLIHYSLISEYCVKNDDLLTGAKIITKCFQKEPTFYHSFFGYRQLKINIHSLENEKYVQGSMSVESQCSGMVFKFHIWSRQD